MNITNPMSPVMICGLEAYDPEMAKNIGRKIRFNYDHNSNRFGFIHRDGEFEIVGIQKNYKGDLRYYVKCIMFEGKPWEDNFGQPANPNEIYFID